MHDKSLGVGLGLGGEGWCPAASTPTLAAVSGDFSRLNNGHPLQHPMVNGIRIAFLVRASMVEGAQKWNQALAFGLYKKTQVMEYVE